MDEEKYGNDCYSSIELYSDVSESQYNILLLLLKKLCKNFDESVKGIKEFCDTELTPEKTSLYIERFRKVVLI